MSVLTLEGVVDNGQIKLKSNMRLPDNTKVYVVVPDVQVQRGAHVYSSHLVHREQAKDFDLKVTEEPVDRVAGLHPGAIWVSDDFDEPLLKDIVDGGTS